MTKNRFEILDGMRGSAALFVVLMHLCEANYPDLADNPFHHAYLGVDFFFMLSGFVVGYAYDHRWGQWSIGDFFRARLIRLHPLVLLSIVIGAIGYVADPYVGDAQNVTWYRMLLAMGVGALLLPSPSLPNRWGETHSLNGPHWTLLQEYLANILYAIIGRKLSRVALIVVTAMCALVLLIVSLQQGQMFLGWGASNMWIAPVRMAFPFFAGLLLFRMNIRLTLPFAYPLLTLLLLAVLIVPVLSPLRLNGLYEFGVIALVFPFIIAAGAGSHTVGGVARMCNFFGRISYPLYITHYPFIYIYTHWVGERHPGTQETMLVGGSLLIGFIVLAYAALKLYDEPVRKWLNAKNKRRLERKKKPALK